jgi:hypothetical protein
MIEQFKCPYCKKINFTSWVSVRNHTSTCDKNTHEFVITEEYGPLHYLQILDENFYTNFPLIGKNKVAGFIKKFKKTKLVDATYIKGIAHSKQSILSQIKLFVEEHGRIPTTRDWIRKTDKYPDFKTVIYHFGTWNIALEQAGFIPNIQNGFGVNTRGIDGHLYRSQAEAYFADTYLYNKYEYLVEPKYPKPYNRYYDWHITTLDLYIELDGGCRPDIAKKKLEINIKLNRKCLILPIGKIYSVDYIVSLLKRKTD